MVSLDLQFFWGKNTSFHDVGKLIFQLVREKFLYFFGFVPRHMLLVKKKKIQIRVA